MEVGDWDHQMSAEEYNVVEISSHYKITPRFIDIHINVVNGGDTMDATKDALDIMNGIHLEGPFINPIRAGAQAVQHIMNPSLENFLKWQGSGPINASLKQ